MSQDQSTTNECPVLAPATAPEPQARRHPYPGTPKELHEYGVAVTAHALKKDGFEEVRCNFEMDIFPQITARRDGRPMNIIVKTAVFPEAAWIESTEEKDFHLRNSKRQGVPCYFAAVRIFPAVQQTGAGTPGESAADFTYDIEIWEMEKILPWEEHLRRIETEARSTRVKTKVDSLN